MTVSFRERRETVAREIDSSFLLSITIKLGRCRNDPIVANNKQLQIRIQTAHRDRELVRKRKKERMAGKVKTKEGLLCAYKGRDREGEHRREERRE
jgi:hypothetical protein